MKPVLKQVRLFGKPMWKAEIALGYRTLEAIRSSMVEAYNALVEKLLKDLKYSFERKPASGVEVLKRENLRVEKIGAVFVAYASCLVKCGVVTTWQDLRSIGATPIGAIHGLM